MGTYEDMAQDSRPLASQLRQIGLLTTVPIVMLIAPLVGYAIGAWLDKRFHTKPYLALGMVLLGFYAAAREIKSILKEVKRIQPLEKEKK